MHVPIHAARLHVCLGRHGGNETCEECRCAVALVCNGTRKVANDKQLCFKLKEV